MIKSIKYVIYTILIFSQFTCRKKSDIIITVYNYALGEPIAYAEVGIFEVRYKGGIFSASAECKEIAHATADVNGRCIFDNVKLKNTKAVQYAAKVKYAYGKVVNYNCNVTQNSELQKTNFNSLVLNNSDFDAYLKVNFINILNPSIIGDSIWIDIKTREYSLPDSPYPYGGGGLIRAFYVQNGNSYPSLISSNTEKTYAGKLPMNIYKRKLGVVTQTTDTIKIQPYETKIIEINW